MAKNFVFLLLFVLFVNQLILKAEASEKNPNRKNQNEVALKENKVIIIPSGNAKENKCGCTCTKDPCKCCQDEDPENWFVKSEPRMKSKCCTEVIKKTVVENPSKNRINLGNCCEELSRLKPFKPSNQKRAKMQGYCHERENPNQLACSKCGKRISRMVCPPITPFNISTECSQCRLHLLDEDSSKVILKCMFCTDFYTAAGAESALANPTRLLQRNVNRLIVDTKFLQITAKELSKNVSIANLLSEKGIRIPNS